jgi:hypothetical protein
MTSCADKVQTSMYTQIRLLDSLRLLLLPHISLVLVIDKVHNRRPRVTIIDIVTKARRVNNSQLDLELFLLEFRFDDFDFGELVELFLMTTAVVFHRRKLSGKQGINESSFAQSRLAFDKKRSARTSKHVKTRRTDNHDGEVSTPLGYNFVFLLANQHYKQRTSRTN